MGFKVFGGEHAPYVWVKTPDGLSSWDFFNKLLNIAYVVGTPGSGFGKEGEGYVRFSAFADKKIELQPAQYLTLLTLAIKKKYDDTEPYGVGTHADKIKERVHRIHKAIRECRFEKPTENIDQDQKEVAYELGDSRNGWPGLCIPGDKGYSLKQPLPEHILFATNLLKAVIERPQFKNGYDDEIKIISTLYEKHKNEA